MSHLAVQILVGFFCGLSGAALKSLLMSRFFMTGGKSFSVLAIIGRFVIDVGLLFATHYWIGALIACALGLTADQVYFIWQSRREKG